MIKTNFTTNNKSNYFDFIKIKRIKRERMRLTRYLNCISKLPKNYANFPESYVKDKLKMIEWQTPRGRNFQRKTLRYNPNPYFDQYKPWSNDFQNHNSENFRYPKIYVEPLIRFPIYKGDRVEVLAGKDKGKIGIVTYTIEERNWVFVEGLNLRREIVEKTYDNAGYIRAEEAPLLINRDVALVDPEDRLPTEIEWRYDEEGKTVRVSTRTDRIIPIPARAFETVDFRFPDIYEEQEKDTKAEDVEEVTFKPIIKTFEMDIMDEMNLKEERNPFPLFWY